MTTSQSRLLIAANALCLAVSAAIVFFAIRDWPARYSHHTLSWSVAAFFVAFVGISVVGSAVTPSYLRTRRGTLLWLTLAPVMLLGTGFALGLLKAIATGDF
jgi:hypothetical protein